MNSVTHWIFRTGVWLEIWRKASPVYLKGIASPLAIFSMACLSACENERRIGEYIPLHADFFADGQVYTHEEQSIIRVVVVIRNDPKVMRDDRFEGTFCSVFDKGSFKLDKGVVFVGGHFLSTEERTYPSLRETRIASTFSPFEPIVLYFQLTDGVSNKTDFHFQGHIPLLLADRRNTDWRDALVEGEVEWRISNGGKPDQVEELFRSTTFEAKYLFENQCP